MNLKQIKLYIYDNYYLYIVRVIDSCITIDQLISCSDWVESINIDNYINCKFPNKSLSNRSDMELVMRNLKLKLNKIIMLKIDRLQDSKKEVKSKIGFNYDRRSID